MAWRETFNDADAYARYIGDAYEEATVRMLAIIRKRLTAGADAPQWAVKKLAEYRSVLRELRREFPDLTPEITDLVDKAYLVGAKEAADELKIASMPNLEPLARGSAVKALALEAVEATNATRFRVLREVTDAYREVVARVVSEHLVGGLPIRKAVQEGLRDLADRGICGFIDKSGKHWTLPSYVEMAVRTAGANSAREGHTNKLEAVGYDLVRVSRFGATCETCAPWEGKVLSLTGKTKGYPTVAEAESDSHLFGPNCRHFTTAWSPNSPPDNPQDQPYDPEAYKAQQKERYNERAIRQWKRREAVATTADEKTLAKAKVKAWQLAQRNHIKSTNEWYSAKYGENTQLLWRKYEREKNWTPPALGAAPEPTLTKPPFVAVAVNTTASPRFVDAVEAGQAVRLPEVASRYGMSVDAYKTASTTRLRELIEQGVPSIQIQGDRLSRVLADGRFKSQFETGTSGGHLSTELRGKFEKQAFGLAEDAEAAKRPIYGFLGDPQSDVAQSGQGPRSYGNATVRLKDSVRERMTVTYGDSASINRWAESPSALPMRAADVDYRAAAHTVEPWVSSPLDCKSLSNVPPGYVEAQYLGGLNVDDIAEVIIESRPQAHYEIYTPPSQELLDNLTKRGIKWRMSK